MNIKNKIWVVVLAVAGVCALQASNNVKKGVIFQKFIEPQINGSLYLDINGHASIDVAILFNDQGYVDDWLTVRTNDKLLIKSISNVIDGWKFNPPMLDGESSWGYIELNLFFLKKGGVLTITPREAVLALFNIMNDDFQMVVPFKELDRIPKPIMMEAPALHKSLYNNNSGKTVLFEFFIDKEGKVRMPLVKESSTENVVTAIILESLLKWKFEPPTHKGVRVATKASIPFNVKK